MLLLAIIFLPFCLAQYGIYGGYGGYGGYGAGYGGYGGYGMPYGGPFMGYGLLPDAPLPDFPIPSPPPTNPPTESQRDCRGLPSMRSRSLCRYGGPNPMTMIGGGMYGNGACMDTNPQCSVWASTGQCATNAMVMRQTCALSCGTCASSLGGLGTSSIYSPYGGLGGLDQYPLSQFIGRSIYETGLLNRQPVPNSSKNIGIITKARAEQLPSR